MPLTHTRLFRVRHYECDIEGRLRAANYLRYMQEAAFTATASSLNNPPKSRQPATPSAPNAGRTSTALAKLIQGSDSNKVERVIEG
jgi:hypothetical protein